MIYIIFFVIALASMICISLKGYRYRSSFMDALGVLSIIASMFFALLGTGMIIDGITDYPWLLSQKEYITSIKSEIETIKAARYDVANGSLVGGSLDNIKQSSNLSEYISNYAKEKARYNAYLKKAQFAEGSTIYKIFSSGAFISKNVRSLTRIE